MEITRIEVGAVEQALVEQGETQLRELVDLELALVGGGQGDINFG